MTTIVEIIKTSKSQILNLKNEQSKLHLYDGSSISRDVISLQFSS